MNLIPRQNAKFGCYNRATMQLSREDTSLNNNNPSKNLQCLDP